MRCGLARPLVLCLLAASSVVAIRAQGGPSAQSIDQVFSEWTSDSPGCAIGVRHRGSTLVRAYGLADLERSVPITPETVFEAGSVAKQFTAAAVLLLAREGRLSLDDPVRKHLPELPDYGQPLTIRHMLNHTSGLRDWGSVAGVGGWPRGSRVYTQAHVLEMAARQRALNFPPGERWSYTNTGYNLAVIIVERVSGTSFEAFTKLRIFDPLGMTHTSWRTDHTRLVRNRAVAYSRQADGFHVDVPFEDAHGNGGLLTTVGDLLTWNANFSDPVVGGTAFVAELQEPGRLANGRSHSYAFGLAIREYKGAREVGHDGATAGYTANLVRFPDHGLSIAVLCNAANAVTPRYTYEVADLYLAGSLAPPSSLALKAAYELTDAEADAILGLYRSVLTGMPMTISAEGGLGARLRGFRLPMFALSPGHFASPFGVSWEFDAQGGSRMLDSTGLVEEYQRVAPAQPTAAELREFAGVYASDEAEAAYTVAVGTAGHLVMRRRPDVTFDMAPIYADTFFNPELGLIAFRRNAERRVTALSISQDRMWDLPFERASFAPDGP